MLSTNSTKIQLKVRSAQKGCESKYDFFWFRAVSPCKELTKLHVYIIYMPTVQQHESHTSKVKLREDGAHSSTRRLSSASTWALGGIRMSRPTSASDGWRFMTKP